MLSENLKIITTNGILPPARYYHTAVAHSDSIIIYGGYSILGDALSDLWQYNIHDNTWTEIFYEGKAPVARAGHTAAIVKYANKRRGTFMWIYGGKTNGNQFVTDMWIFDLTAKTWSVIEQDVSKYDPGALSFAVKSSVMDNALMVFGGKSDTSTTLGTLTLFDLTRNQWYVHRLHRLN